MAEDVTELLPRLAAKLEGMDEERLWEEAIALLADNERLRDECELLRRVMWNAVQVRNALELGRQEQASQWIERLDAACDAHSVWEAHNAPQTE